MSRETQGAVMLLVGGAVLYCALTDLHLRYVKAGLQPLLLVAAAILIATAVATLWHEYRSGRRAGSPEGHGHREPWVSWLLIAPVFALLVAAPPALGSYSADRAGTALQRPVGFAELPAGDPVRISVVDYAARAVYDGGRSLGDRRVTLTGFVTFGRGDTPYLTRMTLNCCAADALPVKVGLAGELPASVAGDTWLEVTGAYVARQVKDEINGGPIPFLQVVQVTVVPAPERQYDD